MLQYKSLLTGIRILRLSPRYCVRFLNHGTMYSQHSKYVIKTESLDTKEQKIQENHIAKSYIAKKLNNMESSLFEKYLKGYNKRQTRIIVFIICLAIVGSCVLYVFREPIKDNISDEVADVASRSLGDESLVLKANEVSRVVIKDIIQDPNTQEIVLVFLKNILNQPEVKTYIVKLVNSIIQDQGLQNEVNKLVLASLKAILSDEYATALLLSYLKSILLSPETNETLLALLQTLVSQKTAQDMLAQFFQEVLSSDTVKDEAMNLGKTITIDILNDDQIQKQTGDALWNIGVRSITPAWWTD